MKVGWNAEKSSSSALRSEECPIRTPAVTASTSMNRAKTCASGRKSSVEEPSALTTAASFSAVFSARVRKLPWVSSTPLGRPVVPEV